MAEIENIGLGSPRPIRRPENLAEQFDMALQVSQDEEIPKPVKRPKFDASKFLDKIIDLSSPAPILRPTPIDVSASAPPLRPAGTGDTVVNIRLNKANASMQNLLDKIAEGEGATPEKLKRQGENTSPYDMVYGYKEFLVPDKPVSTMTLKELFAFQKKLINETKGTIKGAKKNEGTSAVGKYQILKWTLFGKGKNDTAENPGTGSWADVLNLKANDKFTPALQEKIARLALKESGYNAFVEGNKTQEELLKGIAIRWASVADTSGKNPSGQPIATTANMLLPLINDVKINADGRIIKVTELREK